MRAYRDDWSDLEYAAFGTWNEIKLLRADGAAMHAGEEMDLNLFKSPAQRRASEEQEEDNLRLVTGIRAQLYKTTE